MQNASFLAFTNASALTMHTGSLPDDSLQNVTILVQNGRIDAVIASGAAVLPPGTVVIDAEGGQCMICSRLFMMLILLIRCNNTGLHRCSCPLGRA